MLIYDDILECHVSAPPTHTFEVEFSDGSSSRTITVSARSACDAASSVARLMADDTSSGHIRIAVRRAAP